jgi:hypothetical protein
VSRTGIAAMARGPEGMCAASASELALRQEGSLFRRGLAPDDLVPVGIAAMARGPVDDDFMRERVVPLLREQT